MTTSTSAAETTRRETMRLYRIPAAASPELVEAHASGAWKESAKAASVGSGGGAASSSWEDMGDGGTKPAAKRPRQLERGAAVAGHMRRREPPRVVTAGPKQADSEDVRAA